MLPVKIGDQPLARDVIEELATGIAQGLRTPADMARVLGVQDGTIPALMGYPEFMDMVYSMRRKWESLENTPVRTQCKLDLIYEESLERLDRIIHDPKGNPSVQVEAIKMIDKASAMAARKALTQAEHSGAGTGGGGIGAGHNGFSLTINVGGEAKVTMDGTVERDLEHAPVPETLVGETDGDAALIPGSL